MLVHNGTKQRFIRIRERNQVTLADRLYCASQVTF